MSDPSQPALQALLARRSPALVRLGLQPVRRLLARMGNPHLGLAVVHVAGTNGKGSVIAFLEAMLLAAGIPVAVFTSPHLIRFNERIRINGNAIADDALDALLTESLACDPLEETTFFELTTAAALLCFARARPFDPRGPGLVLLETGLGGRLDATNVVRPLLSVITAIGLDHEEYLGHSLAGIAGEKGGILKPGVPAVAAPGHREADRVLSGMARRLGVALRLAGRDFFHAPPGEATRSGHWRFREWGGPVWRLPPPALFGEHQYANAALAVASARALQGMGYRIGDGHVRAGVAQARWPGRLERFPGPPPVWLDGAHNPHAVDALVRSLRHPGMGNPEAPTTLIFSVLHNKNASAMVTLLTPWVQKVFTVVCGGERGRTLEELVALWNASGLPVTPCKSVREAWNQAQGATSSSGRILVTGSLFLVGEMRSLLLYQNSLPGAHNAH